MKEKVQEQLRAEDSAGNETQPRIDTSEAALESAFLYVKIRTEKFHFSFTE
jgi:hypothetical protein